MTTPVARSLFTTEHLTDVTAKMLAWRESASFVFHVDPVHSPARHGFHARIESFFFGSLVTSICESVPTHWRRTITDAAANGLDHFLIQFYIRGHGWILDGHREIRTDPGKSAYSMRPVTSIPAQRISATSRCGCPANWWRGGWRTLMSCTVSSCPPMPP